MPTKEQWIEERAREIMERERFQPCSCGQALHTPECDYTISADIAWYAAKKQASEDYLAYLAVLE